MDMKPISEDHPLQQLFLNWWGVIRQEIGIRDPQIVSYVAHLALGVCDAEQLVKIRNTAGKP